MRVSKLVEQLDRLYPFALAEDWDNVGLIVGDTSDDAHGVLLALDLTHEVIDEAVEHACNVIVTHHPPIFRPIKRLNTAELQGGLVGRAFREGISVISLHTNLDSAVGGLNDTLCELIGLTKVKPLVDSGRERLFKLAVFVPETHADKVREAMCGQGAGAIGDYDQCSFSLAGEGTFRGIEGRANPFIGTPGELERVNERRIEVILRREITGRVIGAMIQAHPYEEVAYDLFPLANTEPGTGLARIGSLPDAESLLDFCTRIDAMGVFLTRVLGEPEREVRKVAVCSGAGSDFTSQACSAGADVFLTAEIKHHHGLQAQHRGMALLEAEHGSLEMLHWPKLKQILDENFEGLNTRVSDSGSVQWRRP